MGAQPTNVPPVAVPAKLRREFLFQSVADVLANQRPPDWLIRGILERDTVALLFGDPGVGKTFFALAWAFCVAAGTEWAGHKVNPGPVLYIAGEGLNGLQRRLRALELSFGRSLAPAPLFISNGATGLCDPLQSAVLIAAVADFSDKHGKPALIVVDTLARNFGPGDENYQKDMALAISTCDELRALTGACVLLVHHSGHGDKSRARGSTALKGAMDWEWRLSRDESGLIRLEATKCKDHEPPPPMAFRFQKIALNMNDEEGLPLTSVVLKQAAYEPQAVAGKAGRGRHQTTAMQLLKTQLQKQRETLEQGGYDADSAKVSLADWKDLCEDQGINPKRFADVRRSLEVIGKVRVDHGYVYYEGAITC